MDPISAGGAILTMADSIFGGNRKVKQAQKMTDMQVRAQKEMSEFNKQIALDMWNDTNYSAQRKHMEKAGLNVGLMYGMGGGGGATANVPAGNVSGHDAELPKPMLAEGMALMQSLQTNKAQEKLIEAQTEKTEAETTKIAGTDTEESQTRIKDLLQGIENQKAQEKVSKVEERLKLIDEAEKNASQEDRLDYISYQTDRAIAELESARNEAYVSSNTISEKVNIIKQTAVKAGLENLLIKENIGLTEDQRKEISARINKMSEDIKQGWDRNKIEAFTREIQAEYPSIFNVGGKVINEITTFLETILGDGIKGRKIDR